MKIIDKKGRLFGAVSLIDILVIVVVIALAAGIYVRFFSIRTTAVAQESDKISYQLTIEAVRSFQVDGIKSGDKIFSMDGHDIGTIISVSAEEAMQWGPTHDGTAKKGPVQDYYDIMLEVEADGVVSEGKYYVSRTAVLGAGKQTEFSTKYSTFTATVTEIHEVQP